MNDGISRSSRSTVVRLAASACGYGRLQPLTPGASPAGFMPLCLAGAAAVHADPVASTRKGLRRVVVGFKLDGALAASFGERIT
jgi:hypothetical protein